MDLSLSEDDDRALRRWWKGDVGCDGGLLGFWTIRDRDDEWRDLLMNTIGLLWKIVSCVPSIAYFVSFSRVCGGGPGRATREYLKSTLPENSFSYVAIILV